MIQQKNSLQLEMASLIQRFPPSMKSPDKRGSALHAPPHMPGMACGRYFHAKQYNRKRLRSQQHAGEIKFMP